MIFDNDDALEIALNNAIYQVVDEVSDIILAEIKEMVQQVVYDPYDPELYDRKGENGGFLGSWDVSFSDEAMIKNAVELRIFSNPDKMIFSYYTHGNQNLGEDRRDIMDIAIAEGTDWDFSYEGGEAHEWWKEPRDYMSPVITMLDHGYFDGLVRSAFRNANINYLVI